jgi:hypothetical protein
MQTDVFLHFHDIADAHILNAREGISVDPLRGAVAERLPQRRRSQQAADVVGPERRSAFALAAHPTNILASVLGKTAVAA